MIKQINVTIKEDGRKGTKRNLNIRILKANINSGVVGVPKLKVVFFGVEP